MPSDTRPPAQPPRRSPWKWLARLVVGAAIVWLLARGVGDAPLEGIRRAPLGLLVACVAAYWAGQVLSARRWQMLLDALARPAEPIAAREVLGWYAAGMFWNLWMPTGLGGDAARALLAGRRVQSGSAGALSVVLDRALGLACLLALGLVALIADTRVGQDEGAPSAIFLARRLLLAGVAVGACALVLLAATWRVLARHPRVQNSKLSQALALAVSSGALKNPRVLGSAVLLSLCVQAIQIAINVALARAVGLDIAAASMAWIAPVLALSSVVPLGLGGLGARETGAVALLGASFGRGDILAWSLLWQAVVWLSSLLGAPLAWRWRHLNAPST